MTGASWDVHRRWARRALERLRKQPDEREHPLFVSATALLKANAPRSSWLVEGVVPKKSVTVLAGPPKNAKTWQAADLALAVATGTPALGAYSVTGKRTAAMVLAEDDAADVRERLSILARGRGIDPMLAVQKVHVCCRCRLNLLDDEDMVWLLASLKALPHLPALIVLDPLVNLFNIKNENDAADMVQVVDALRCLRDITAAAVVFVHHSRKPKDGAGAQKAGHQLRGSSVLYGGVDAGLYMRAAGDQAPPVWENEMLMEARALPAAGRVTVRLELVPSEQGPVAVWQASASRPKGKLAARDTVKKVLMDASPEFLLRKEIRHRAQIGDEGVSEALDALIAGHEVERRARKGFRWRGPGDHPISTRTNP